MQFKLLFFTFLFIFVSSQTTLYAYTQSQTQDDVPACRYQNRGGGNIDVGIRYPGQSEDDIEWVWQGQDADPFPRLKELQEMGVCN